MVGERYLEPLVRAEGVQDGNRCWPSRLRCAPLPSMKADRTLDHDSIMSTALEHGVDEEVAAEAARRIMTREVSLLGFSGKLASGKDSVAAGVVRRLRLDPVLHYSFAHPLKDEVDTVLNLLRTGREGDIPPLLDVREGVPLTELLDLARVALAEDPGCDARTRTPAIRRVLQHWGTEIRRAQDYDYWVKSATRTILTHAATGTNVFYTDGRFPNEISSSRQIGFVVFRLQVDPLVQAERLSHRDGIGLDPLAQQHPSETALDHFDQFDLKVDNNGPFEQTVSHIVNWLQRS